MSNSYNNRNDLSSQRTDPPIVLTTTYEESQSDEARNVSTFGNEALFATVHSMNNPQNVEKVVLHDPFFIGKGTFGVVFKMKICSTNGSRKILDEFPDGFCVVKSLKKTNQKDRELQMYRVLRHPNILHVPYFYETFDDKVKCTHLIMEYIPSDLFTFIRNFGEDQISDVILTVIMFQILNGLTYLHSKAICHRDLKPQNILINTDTYEVKICDLGSAKNFAEEYEKSIFYIGSRFYRSPELLFRNPDYDCSTDMWSFGCVLGEMTCKKVVFEGKDSVEQMIKIIKLVGTPDFEDFVLLFPGFRQRQLPKFPNVLIEKFSEYTRSEFILNLLAMSLMVNPAKRITAFQAIRNLHFYTCFINGALANRENSRARLFLSLADAAKDHLSAL